MATNRKQTKSFWDRLAQAGIFRFFLNSDHVWELILKCLLLAFCAVAFPVVWAILNAVVFEVLLKWYFMTTFTFVVLVILVAGSLFVLLPLAVWAIVRYAQGHRRSATGKAGK